MTRRVWGALVAIGVLVAVGAPLADAQPSEPHTPPWRDLAQARAEWRDAIGLVSETTAEVAAHRQALADAEAAVAALDADAATLGVDIVVARDKVAAAAIDAYVGGRDVAELLYALDTADAADATFRATLVVTHLEVLGDATEEYHSLRDRASAELIAAIDAVSVAADELARAERARSAAEKAVADAAWVVTIAEVHAAADQLMTDNGRTEPTAQQWTDLRWCEGHGRYDIDTGNGYYGTYQFDLTTWVGVGGTGNPADAPPEEQDARARYLYALRGRVPWPICGPMHLP